MLLVESQLLRHFSSVVYLLLRVFNVLFLLLLLGQDLSDYIATGVLGHGEVGYVEYFSCQPSLHLLRAQPVLRFLGHVSDVRSLLEDLDWERHEVTHAKLDLGLVLDKDIKEVVDLEEGGGGCV